VHDNDLQHTVDEDGGPQTYDKEAVPATVDEEVVLAMKDEEAAMVGGSTSPGTSKPYQQGPVKLLKRSIHVERRPMIAPEGDK
jgi:hypothetical protein